MTGPACFGGLLLENIPHFFHGYGPIWRSILEIYIFLQVIYFMSYDQMGHTLPNLSVRQSWRKKKKKVYF